MQSLSGSLAKDAANAVIEAFSAAMASAATWLVRHVVGLVGATTQVHLQSAWFSGRENAMVDVAMLVVLPVLMAATIGPVLHQDLRRLARVWGVGLPLALAAGLLGTQFASLALAATDKLCQVIAGNSAASFGSAFSGVVVSQLMPGDPPLVAAMVSLLLIAGTVMVWLELLVRAAAVSVAVFFMPLVLVTYIWPATAAMAKRVVEILAALILSKFVIVATLSLGASALHGRMSADKALTAGAILLLAGFAPFTLMRLAPVVETAAIGHLEGMSRRPFRAVAGAASMAVSTGVPVAGLLMSAKGGSPASKGPD
ncbi:MAG: hypothetical protein ACRDWW_00445, partial [Acidimicrobiales bacterium]